MSVIGPRRLSAAPGAVEAPVPPAAVEPAPPISETPVSAPPAPVEAKPLPPQQPKLQAKPKEQPKDQSKPKPKPQPKPEKDASAKKPRSAAPAGKALPSCAVVQHEYESMNYSQRMSAYFRATPEEIAHGKRCLGL